MKTKIKFRNLVSRATQEAPRVAPDPQHPIACRGEDVFPAGPLPGPAYSSSSIFSKNLTLNGHNFLTTSPFSVILFPTRP
ncbi:hypothetical protein Hanom_Chr12g01155291 [Helianthus anomalus]